MQMRVGDFFVTGFGWHQTKAWTMVRVTRASDFSVVQVFKASDCDTPWFSAKAWAQANSMKKAA